MKKLLAILVLGLLFCNIAKAKECEGSPFVEKKRTLIFFKNLLNGKTAMVHLLLKMVLNMLEILRTENFQAEEVLHGKKGNLLERNTLENF